jgi:hypothetical protein
MCALHVGRTRLIDASTAPVRPVILSCVSAQSTHNRYISTSIQAHACPRTYASTGTHGQDMLICEYFMKLIHVSDGSNARALKARTDEMCDAADAVFSPHG